MARHHIGQYTRKPPEGLFVPHEEVCMIVQLSVMHTQSLVLFPRQSFLFLSCLLPTQPFFSAILYTCKAVVAQYVLSGDWSPVTASTVYPVSKAIASVVHAKTSSNVS